MKLFVYIYMSMVVLGVQAWPSVKRAFELYPSAAPPYHVQTISDCMHVASEPGDYIFKKTAQSAAATLHQPLALLELEAGAAEAEAAAAAAAAAVADAALAVCGLYVIGEPDTIVEITMKHYDVNCETGGLLAFVDGWELNGQYFPGVQDHHRELEDRVFEFCNNYRQWPRIVNKKFFRSSQNAALLQYRIPTRGSFVANVKFHKISQPCNIMVQDTVAVYKLANFGYARNCTLSALFPAAVSLTNVRIGSKAVRAEPKANYECQLSADRLEVGGSAGLDPIGMELSHSVCGASNKPGPETGIFCGVTNVRLLSTGRYQNQATVVIRKADEKDFQIATLMCTL